MEDQDRHRDRGLEHGERISALEASAKQAHEDIRSLKVEVSTGFAKIFERIESADSKRSAEIDSIAEKISSSGKPNWQALSVLGAVFTAMCVGLGAWATLLVGPLGDSATEARQERHAIESQQLEIIKDGAYGKGREEERSLRLSGIEQRLAEGEANRQNMHRHLLDEIGKYDNLIQGFSDELGVIRERVASMRERGP